MKILERIKSNLIYTILAVLSFVFLLIAVIFYPSASEENFTAFVIVFAIIGMLVLLASVLFDLKGFASIASALCIALCFGVYLVSRLEYIGYFDVGITAPTSAFYGAMVFFPLALASAIASAIFEKCK